MNEECKQIVIDIVPETIAFVKEKIGESILHLDDMAIGINDAMSMLISIYISSLCSSLIQVASSTNEINLIKNTQLYAEKLFNSIPDADHHILSRPNFSKNEH